MKVGDIVSWHGRPCVVTEIYESKVWRTEDMGKRVDFAKIDSEPFVRIMVALGDLRGVPQVDVELISASR